MATITKGKTFISGETVEPDDMHQLVDNATVTNIVDADIASGAAIALSKLATGALPAAITTTTGNMVDGSVTTAKVADNAITADKLDGVVNLNNVSANYTLVLADATRAIEFTNVSNVTLTVPANASVPFATGTQILLIRRLTGEVTIAGASGVTINSADSKFRIDKQYTTASLIKISTNTWMLFGSLKV